MSQPDDRSSDRVDFTDYGPALDRSFYIGSCRLLTKSLDRVLLISDRLH